MLRNHKSPLTQFEIQPAESKVVPSQGAHKDQLRQMMSMYLIAVAKRPNNYLSHRVQEANVFKELADHDVTVVVHDSSQNT